MLRDICQSLHRLHDAWRRWYGTAIERDRRVIDSKARQYGAAEPIRWLPEDQFFPK